MLFPVAAREWMAANRGKRDFLAIWKALSPAINTAVVAHCMDGGFSR